MAKFCGKCGAKLDEKTGICPNCHAVELMKQQEPQPEAPDESKIVDNPTSTKAQLNKKEAKRTRKAQKKAAKKAERKAKLASMTIGQKLCRILLKLFVVLLFLAIIVAGVVGTLVYFELFDLPILSEAIDNLLPNSYSSDVEKDTPETDTSGFAFYQSSEENIAQDADTGITFINNEILVTLISERYKNHLEEYLQSIGGQIVGEIAEFAEYQILLDKAHLYSDIIELVDAIESLYWVSSASPNYAMKMDVSYAPNDSKWKNKWEDVPDGDNWGMEAIDAPGAWEYRGQLQSVNIGILDDMFDTKHQDLNFAELPLGSTLTSSAIAKGDIKWSSHGTHTSGTIAAIFDNSKGVTGVSIKTNLYGVSASGLSTAGYYSSQAWNIALYYLIAEKNCSAVNISMGYDQITFEASRGEALATETLNLIAKEIETCLKMLIDRNYSFIICKSAGNQNQVGGSYQYFKKDSDDENTVWSYYSYSQYIDYINGDKTNESTFSRYKDRREEIEGQLESGNVDAKYDILGAITDESVRKRIIIVGAAENLGTHKEGGFLGIGGTKVHDGYTIATFSQCGERVDVIAPGVDIHSTVKNGYGKMSGTSMAAPHVTGVVGLMFSASPNINADAVKRIICNSATGEYGSEKYGLVNAKNAVDVALDYTADGTGTKTGGQFDQSNIPDGAGEFNGHYYYIYDIDTIKGWNEAQKYCEARGGYLATITSADEDSFLYSYIVSRGYYSAMFGLTDQDTTNTWTWITGEPFFYKNWRSGEPNHQGGYEHFGMYYERNTDGSWNDGSGAGGPFICEWGEYEINHILPGPTRTMSDERDVVLALDVSASMSGTPMEQTRRAATNFVNTILAEDASIGIVTYDDTARVASDPLIQADSLLNVISHISSGGNTNIEDGLSIAYDMLQISKAKKKIIVLMSDGEPNRGKEGDDLIAYADAIKNSGVMIYTLGFFENMGSKSAAQILMERLASDGCHYEVANADDLVFFFEDVADQINGQRYIYVRIACPVDVSVTYNGETLSSAENNLNLRTAFGTLTFEENVETSSTNANDQIKVLRLKEGVDYDLQIVGTGRGIMNYTIGFMDENGDYCDFRRFENIKISKKTVINTVASVSNTSVLSIDEDGDGKYDVRFQAGENEYGKEVAIFSWTYILIGVSGASLLILVVMVVYVKKSHGKTEKARKGE